jgi:hypothetical protein
MLLFLDGLEGASAGKLIRPVLSENVHIRVCTMWPSREPGQDRSVRLSEGSVEREYGNYCAVARATTTAMTNSEKRAWTIDRIFARLLITEVSVGPKAVLWLKARNR